MKLAHALLTLSVFSIAAVPSVLNAVPHCTAEDRIYADSWNNYYEPEDAHKFGRIIQQLVADRDLAGLFGLVEGELSSGPRKRFIQSRTFGEVFTENWRRAVLASEPPCKPMGWRGFMLANGLIWFNFDLDNSRTWQIFAMNDASKETYALAASGLAWRIEGRIVPPQCFVKIWMSADNFEAYEETFGITDTADFRRNTGRYFGRQIDRLDPIDAPWGGEKVHLATFPRMCSSADPYSPDKTTTTPIVSGDEVLSKKCDKHGTCVEAAYRLLSSLPLTACENLAPHLPGQCESAYLVRIGDYGGGSMGWDYQFNIYGLFALDDGRRAIVPLVNFYNENEARNLIDEIGEGR